MPQFFMGDRELVNIRDFRITEETPPDETPEWSVTRPRLETISFTTEMDAGDVVDWDAITKQVVTIDAPPWLEQLLAIYVVVDFFKAVMHATR